MYPGRAKTGLCLLHAGVPHAGRDSRGSKVLAKGEVGAPMFWQKSPSNWAKPDNTLSRNCAGCHATGLTIKTKDFPGSHQYKSVVTDWDYKDLNITCERCHGPGSEHAKTSDKTQIICPRYLTAKAGNELCGQCHGSHDGKSQNPMGVFKPPYDAKYKDTLGHGFFVPGVYDLETFYFNFDNLSTRSRDRLEGGSVPHLARPDPRPFSLHGAFRVASLRPLEQ